MVDSIISATHVFDREINGIQKASARYTIITLEADCSDYILRSNRESTKKIKNQTKIGK